MNIGFEFIKYSLNAKGRQGIHSPFVYNLMDKVLSMPISSAIKDRQKELFAALKSDNTSIEFQEFGAGSKKLGKLRTVQQIYSTNSTQKKIRRIIIQNHSCLRTLEGLRVGNIFRNRDFTYALGKPKGRNNYHRRL